MTSWVLDEQQLSFVRQVFDLEIHPVLDVRRGDIDPDSSLSIGQNRMEVQLDADTVEIISLYMADGISMPMPLVWKPNMRTRRVVVLDGNHRLDAALRVRGDECVPCVLITGDMSVATDLAAVVNAQHGRSSRTPEYTAMVMRSMRERGVPMAEIGRMFGIDPDQVARLTRRHEQAQRVRTLVPDANRNLSAHTLDLLGQVEDAHLRILGETFLTATKAQQRDIVERLRDAASAERDALAYELRGGLLLLDEQRRKHKARPSRPASRLQDALQRLTAVADPTTAYRSGTDQQRAVMRSNLAEVMPRLQRLWLSITETSAVA